MYVYKSKFDTDSSIPLKLEKSLIHQTLDQSIFYILIEHASTGYIEKILKENLMCQWENETHRFFHLL